MQSMHVQVHYIVLSQATALELYLFGTRNQAEWFKHLAPAGRSLLFALTSASLVFLGTVTVVDYAR